MKDILASVVELWLRSDFEIAADYCLAAAVYHYDKIPSVSIYMH